MRPRAIGPLRRIITVANLRIEKGHDTLLDAARRIVRDQPDVEFLLVGDGPLRRTLEERVRRDDLTRHVRFLGERTDVASLLHAADLFVPTFALRGMSQRRARSDGHWTPRCRRASRGLPK